MVNGMADINQLAQLARPQPPIGPRRAQRASRRQSPAAVHIDWQEGLVARQQRDPLLICGHSRIHHASPVPGLLAMGNASHHLQPGPIAFAGEPSAKARPSTRF